jgi:mono/diheme cytochrome c family protein
MREAAEKGAMVLILFLAACGSERRTDSAAGASNTGSVSDTAVASAAPAPAPAADTAAQADTTSTAATPVEKPAAKPPPKPAPQAPAVPAESKSSAQQPAPETESAPLRDAYHQAPRDTVSQAVYNGWKQFNLNCARCHGEDVQGTTIAPHLILSLKPDGPVNTKELFVQIVCAGRPAKGMPSWCALGMDMEKINQIYEYVHGRSAAKIGPGRPAVKREG